MTAPRRLAFVSATAGSAVGGAEMALRELAAGLAGRGWSVDLLTSCAEDIYTWRNVTAPGVTAEGDLTVRRFPAEGLTQPERDRYGARILAGETLNLPEQYRWVNSGMRVPALFDYVADHAGEYRAIVCGPYMFWMSLALADLAPERTILMPCLHDEPFARLEVYRYQMSKVAGLWFLSEPEQALAESLGIRGRRAVVVGSAVSPPPAPDPAGFRARHGIGGPFVLFAGRREWGKGWPQLLDDLAFASEVVPDPLPLVTCGVGEVGAIPAPARVIDVGLVSEADRVSAQAAAAACIQPSAMESFSRTVLESMQVGTPVIANDASAVVRWHCRRSGAGVTYANRYEFAESLRLLQEEPGLFEEMGRAGPAYVEHDFRWPAVVDRAERALEEWR